MAERPEERSSTPVFFMPYRGRSMYFTLFPSDRVAVELLSPSGRVRVGDVVVFTPPSGTYLIAHRVAKIEGRIIRTRGDHNARPDPWSLAPEDILGRAAYVYRGRKKINLYAGCAGRWWALGVGIVAGITRGSYSMLRPCLGWAYRENIFLRCFKPIVRTRFFNAGPDDYEIHLLLGRLIIGRYFSRRNCWHLRRPFAVLLKPPDVAHLPQHGNFPRR